MFLQKYRSQSSNATLEWILISMLACLKFEHNPYTAWAQSMKYFHGPAEFKASISRNDFFQPIYEYK